MHAVENKGKFNKMILRMMNKKIQSMIDEKIYAAVVKCLAVIDEIMFVGRKFKVPYGYLREIFKYAMT
jgi:hypothetical protein